MPLWREEAKTTVDTEEIRRLLDVHGVCVVPGLASREDTERLRRQFVQDANDIFCPDVKFAAYELRRHSFFVTARLLIYIVNL